MICNVLFLVLFGCSFAAIPLRSFLETEWTPAYIRQHRLRLWLWLTKAFLATVHIHAIKMDLWFMSCSCAVHFIFDKNNRKWLPFYRTLDFFDIDLISSCVVIPECLYAHIYTLNVSFHAKPKEYLSARERVNKINDNFDGFQSFQFTVTIKINDTVKCIEVSFYSRKHHIKRRKW